MRISDWSSDVCSSDLFDVIKTVTELESRLDEIDEPIDLAVIGCVVNGPGEAREAAIGVAGGYPNSIYVDGKIQHKAHNAELVDVLERLVREQLAERRAARAAVAAPSAEQLQHMANLFQSVRGLNDVLPFDRAAWPTHY